MPRYSAERPPAVAPSEQAVEAAREATLAFERRAYEFDAHGALGVAEEFARAANKRWDDASKAAKGDDAAYDAVKNSNTVQVMTTGNRDMKHPYYRALYPYFNPEAESHWIAAAGLQKLSGEGAKAKYGLITKFDEAGNGKWWAVAGTGAHIYSSSVVDGDYFIPGQTDPLWPRHTLQGPWALFFPVIRT